MKQRQFMRNTMQKELRAYMRQTGVSSKKLKRSVRVPILHNIYCMAFGFAELLRNKKGSHCQKKGGKGHGK